MNEVTTIGLDLAKRVFRCTGLTHRARWCCAGS
jgi:hypothetical protein